MLIIVPNPGTAFFRAPALCSSPPQRKLCPIVKCGEDQLGSFTTVLLLAVPEQYCHAIDLLILLNFCMTKIGAAGAAAAAAEAAAAAAAVFSLTKYNVLLKNVLKKV